MVQSLKKSVYVFVGMWSKCGKIVTVNESDWRVCQYDCTTLSTFMSKIIQNKNWKVRKIRYIKL